LATLSHEQTAEILLKHALDFAARQEEGALLGALLITRHGEDMRGHVRSMLVSLGRNPIFGQLSLRDVYAMIAGMHAENLLFLSRSVLACALGCSHDQLERDVLGVLHREALLDTGGAYVLTRHRRIAEAACIVLEEDGAPVSRWYPVLARAALRYLRANRSDAAHFQDWCFNLAEHFVQQGPGKWSIAEAVAKVLTEADPDRSDHRRITFYSSILRRTGQPARACEVLQAASSQFANQRAFLCEWATAAGASDEDTLDVWLLGRALADSGSPLKPVDCKMALAGLGVAFGRLFETRELRIFADAQMASGSLGMRLNDLDARAAEAFTRAIDEGRRNGAREFKLHDALECVVRAIVRAAEDLDPGKDPAQLELLLGAPETYRYTKLRRLISGE
jgi:hypothetical protein